MTDDIVDWLREVRGPNVWEASAEIERLREALQLILKINPYGDGQGYLMRGVAWNALQQKDSE